MIANDKTKIEFLTQELAELQSTYEDISCEMRALEEVVQQRDELAQDLQASIDEIVDLRRRCFVTQDEVKAITTERDSIAVLLSEKEQRDQELEHQVEKLTTALEDQSKELNGVMNDREGMLRAISEKEVEMAAAIAEAQRVNADQHIIQRQLDEANEIATASQSIIKDLTKSLAEEKQLRANLELSNSEMEALLQRVSEKASEYDAKMDETIDMLSSQRQRIADLELSLQSSLERARDVERQLSLTKTEYGELHWEKDRLLKEVDALSNSTVALQAEHSRQLESLRRNCVSLITSANNHCRALEEQLRTKD